MAAPEQGTDAHAAAEAAAKALLSKNLGINMGSYILGEFTFSTLYDLHPFPFPYTLTL